MGLLLLARQSSRPLMHRRIFLLLLVSFALLPILPLHADSLTGKDLVQFTPISQGILRAPRLTLFEGLPHGMFEARQLKKELASRKTIRLRGYPFYARPLPIPTDLIEPLRRLSTAPESYHTYGGTKFCGGFHPDYCLTWNEGKAAYHLLICFGCREMKLFGPNTELIVHIRESVCRNFESTLQAFRSQRPLPE